jgi:tetratricopeptide (TPR) repeat protein
LFWLIVATSLGGQSVKEYATLLANALREENNGNYLGAREILRDVLEKWPASTRAALLLGSIEQNLGDPANAERLFLRVAHASAPRSEDRLFALACLGGLYYETRQSAKGERVRVQIAALIDDFPRHSRLSADAWNALGQLEQARHSRQDAIRCFERSIELWMELEGATSINAAISRQNIATVLVETGQLDEAASMYRDALARMEPQLGPAHPLLIRTFTNLAATERKLGRPAEAEQLAARAVLLCSVSLGAGGSLRVQAMMEQARALRQLKRKNEARSLEREARALFALTDTTEASRSVVDAGLYTTR